MNKITRHMRVLALTALMVFGGGAAAWAGCPPVDLDDCTIMHERSDACDALEAAHG